jgi:hypothetical protein
MNYPECPVCGKGRLVPLSGTMGDHHAWVCIRPDCRYAIGDDLTYYKGQAAAEEVHAGAKEYVKFDF